MKPPLDHKVRRPTAYRTAEETRQPNYLADRFRALREEQARREHVDEKKRETKVRQIRASR